LWLVPECIVLPGDGILHILTPRGAFDVKGRDAHLLHERLCPFLQGTHTEADLLAGVPPLLASTIQSYLGRLRLMGALREEVFLNPGTALPHAMHSLGAANPVLSCRVGSLRVRVSLREPATTRPGDLHVCFVAPEQAAQFLLRLGRLGWRPGRLTCVVVDPAPGLPTHDVLDQRAEYARWLLRHELDVLPDRPRFQLFRLDPLGGTLERMVSAEAEDGSDLSSVPDQIGLVRALAGVDQLPLVVAQAFHAFFAHSVVGYGLDFPRVQEHLVKAFLARAPIRPGADMGYALRSGAVGARLRTYDRVRVPFERVTCATVAASFVSLQLQLLEELADSRAAENGVAWEEADLLAGEADEHPSVAYLRGVLRLRMSRLPGRLAVTSDGLFICEAGSRRARSFVRAKAVAEVLLDITWDEFYAPAAAGTQRAMPMALCDHEEFASAAQIRGFVQASTKELAANGEPIRILVRRLRRWGTRAWVGALDNRAVEAVP
jgi:hypothetical protein